MRCRCERRCRCYRPRIGKPHIHLQGGWWRVDSDVFAATSLTRIAESWAEARA